MSRFNKMVLLNTSAGTDVQYVGGLIQIPGLDDVKQTRVVDFSQINYRAEVQQVVTVAVPTTPTASTKYTVLIGDNNRKANGKQELLVPYSYTTSATLATEGASDALRREYIALQIIAKINAITSNYVVAATLTGGAGFTITDDAGYYPYNRQGMTNRLGATRVAVDTNEDGSGFVAASVTLTTRAVYSVGVGANLANSAAVYDLVTGHLIAGEIDYPKTISGAIAVSGQKYNMFNIAYLADVTLPNIGDANGGLAMRYQQVWVDNGTGSSTSNLAGYIAFERAMHRGIAYQYASNPSAQVDFLDNVILFQGAAGAVPTTTGENKMVSDAKWVYNQIGTQTITVPTPSNDGLILDQDLIDTEGAEYTPSLLTNAPQEFTVGKTDFSIFARLKAGDYTDAAWQVGFRKKAAHAADFNNYTDLASVGTLAADGDLVVTNGILNNAATVSTSTAVAPTNAAYLTAEVLVKKDGTVTCKLNDVVYPVYSAGTTALILDDGDIMIPFIRYANISTGDPDLVLNEVIAIPTANWKS